MKTTFAVRRFVLYIALHLFKTKVYSKKIVEYKSGEE